MSGAERVLALTLLGIVVTGVAVITGRVADVDHFVILGWLGVLSGSAYGAYLVSAFSTGGDS